MIGVIGVIGMIGVIGVIRAPTGGRILIAHLRFLPASSGRPRYAVPAAHRASRRRNRKRIQIGGASSSVRNGRREYATSRYMEGARGLVREAT